MTATRPDIGVGREPDEDGAGTAQTPSIGAWRPSLGSLGRRTALIGVWIAMAAVFAVLEPDLFLSSGTFQTIFGSQQALVFAGLAAMCTFIVGEFDLSIASNLGIAATIAPVAVADLELSVWQACLLAIFCSIGIGLVNALVIVVLRVDAIVTTLGMATLVSGLSSRISDSGTVSITSPGLADIASHEVLGLPTNFFYGLAVAAVLGYVTVATPLGQHLMFVGSNRSVAALAGIRVQGIRFGSYVASGLLCGVGGVLVVGTVGGFNPATANSYLLPALAATFLGTAVVRPGRFNPLGTLIGIYFLATGIVGLQLLGLAGWISDVFYGSALIVAMLLSTRLRPAAS